MSGIEATGIILGVIPLLISTLEHYADGVDTIQNWRRYKYELKAILGNLKTEHSIFTNTCEKFLDGLLKDQVLQKALDNPDEFDWQDPAFERQLRQRLHKSYDSFMFNVSGMRDALEELKKRLGVNRDGKIEWIDRPLMIRAWKAGKLSLRKSSYEDLITQLKSHNRALQELTQQTHGLYQSRRKRGQASRLKKLRGCAEGLLRALRGLGCSCSGTHSAGIELLPQPIARKHDDSEEERLKAQCSIVKDDGSGKQQPLSISIDILIQTAKVPIVRKPANHPPHNIKGKKSVKWLGSCENPMKSPEKTIRILNLCQIFSPPSQYIGSIADQLEYKFWQSESHQTYKYPGIPLARALESQGPILSRLDKLALSAALAHGVLWLHPTDWLEPNFNIGNFDVSEVIASGRNASFKRLYLNHEIPSSNSSAALLNPTNPSLQRLPSTQSMPEAPNSTDASNSNGTLRLTRANSVPKSKRDDGSSASHPFIQNETMFGLGLTLIQLCLGKTMAQLQTTQDQQSIKPYTDQYAMNCATSKRLLNTQKILEEGGAGFDTAIRWCIWGDPRWRNDLEDDDFRQSVYDNVVSPLEQEFDQFQQTIWR
jgi:hypothetical protein